LGFVFWYFYKILIKTKNKSRRYNNIIQQFKNNESKNSNKLHLDKYYTSPNLAKHCINKTYEIIGEEYITQFIEPSAGNGSFSNQLKNCVAYDIEPDGENIIKQDFLELNIKYKKGRCIIGNPPFGDRMNLATQFVKKSYRIGDYIAFILPLSQYNNNYQFYEFDLIHSEDLGVQRYTDRNLHCCFNIYKRPDNGQLNKRKTYNFTDLYLFESNISKDPKRNREYPNDDYDFRICIWGASTGRILDNNERFQKEVAFYINNKELKEKIYQAMIEFKNNMPYIMTSTPSLRLWQLYEYIIKKIPEIK